MPHHMYIEISQCYVDRNGIEVWSNVCICVDQGLIIALIT